MKGRLYKSIRLKSGYLTGLAQRRNGIGDKTMGFQGELCLIP